MKNAEEYAKAIMDDDRRRIVSEKPTEYSDDRIERIYEFEDGAIVKYEWQSTPDGRTSQKEHFNHRFSLIKKPSPNPNKIKEGVIKVINYPRS